MEKVEKIWNESKDVFKHHILDCALKPRYEVLNRIAGDWDVWDNEKEKVMARFYSQNFIRNGINARAEAKKLCKQLNEGNF